MVKHEPLSDEIERLERVYAVYGEDRAARRRWSDSNPGNRAIREERTSRVRALLASGDRHPPYDYDVLELGCGTGQVLADLEEAGPIEGTIIGLDLSEARLRTATQGLREVSFLRAEGSAMPFPSERFDLVLAFTVFSSVLDESLARRIANEVGRILRPGGALLWYDMRHPNPRNRHTRALRRRDIEGMFRGWTMVLEPITLLPPLSRRLGPATSWLYDLLGRIRPLRTHYVGLVRKPGISPTQSR